MEASPVVAKILVAHFLTAAESFTPDPRLAALLRTNRLFCSCLSRERKSPRVVKNVEAVMGCSQSPLF